MRVMVVVRDDVDDDLDRLWRLVVVVVTCRGGDDDDDWWLIVAVVAFLFMFSNRDCFFWAGERNLSAGCLLFIERAELQLSRRPCRESTRGCAVEPTNRILGRSLSQTVCRSN